MGTESLIRVTCLPLKINRYGRFHLLVDGSDQGVLPWGKPVEVPILPGQHTVTIKTAGLGILDREVELSAGATVNLVCSLSHEGLISAARSKHTEVWDGPSPINLWIIEDGDLPVEPSPARDKWWTVTVLSQEALADSPFPFWRIYHRVVIKHYVAFGLVSSLTFSLLLFETLSQPNPSLLWIPLALIVVATLMVMILRGLARRQISPSSVDRPSPDL
jgi:hypothetical protein